MDIWDVARRAGIWGSGGSPRQWGLMGQMDTFGAV